ncbi:MAG: hypothetical protein E7379_04080 [Clostridiales bacterium]|nr:hypothetical protein [Clostridiales bacterium]
MKSECKEFLQDYISRHYYENSEEYDFCALFRQYSAFEIRCRNDIKPAIDEFFAFLKIYNDIIFKNGIKNPPKLIRYSSKALHSLFDKPLSAGQYVFAEVVKKIAPSKRETAILEVGAGMYPKTAIYLAQTMNNISVMEKNLILSNESMKAMNVDAYREVFNDNTQIKDYDFIVGRFPCTAIESIVSSCTKENKPFFIELCSCALPKESGQAKDIKQWENILKQYDCKIKFLQERYVHNMDISNGQFQKIRVLHSSGTRIARKTHTDNCFDELHLDEDIDLI